MVIKMIFIWIICTTLENEEIKKHTLEKIVDEFYEREPRWEYVIKDSRYGSY